MNNNVKYLYIGKNKLKESLLELNNNNTLFIKEDEENILTKLLSLIPLFRQTITSPTATTLEVLEKSTQGLQTAIHAEMAIGSGAQAVSKLKFAQKTADAAGAPFMEWIKTQFNLLKEGLGRLFSWVIQAIGTAARAAYQFISGLFGAGKEGGMGGIYEYLKSDKFAFLNIPLTTWLVWSAIAAFCVIIVNKLVKWLRNRKQNESVDVFINELNNLNQFFNSTRITENTAPKIYETAKKNVLELEQNTRGAEKGSKFWQIIKKITVFFLLALSVHASVMATGGWAGKGPNVFAKAATGATGYAN